jgi:hypothetical protein
MISCIQFALVCSKDGFRLAFALDFGRSASSTDFILQQSVFGLPTLDMMICFAFIHWWFKP